MIGKFVKNGVIPIPQPAAAAHSLYVTAVLASYGKRR